MLFCRIFAKILLFLGFAATSWTRADNDNECLPKFIRNAEVGSFASDNKVRLTTLNATTASSVEECGQRCCDEVTGSCNIAKFAILIKTDNCILMTLKPLSSFSFTKNKNIHLVQITKEKRVFSETIPEIKQNAENEKQPPSVNKDNKKPSVSVQNENHLPTSEAEKFHQEKNMHPKTEDTKTSYEKSANQTEMNGDLGSSLQNKPQIDKYDKNPIDPITHGKLDSNQSSMISDLQSVFEDVVNDEAVTTNNISDKLSSDNADKSKKTKTGKLKGSKDIGLVPEQKTMALSTAREMELNEKNTTENHQVVQNTTLYKTQKNVDHGFSFPSSPENITIDKIDHNLNETTLQPPTELIPIKENSSTPLPTVSAIIDSQHVTNSTESSSQVPSISISTNTSTSSFSTEQRTQTNTTSALESTNPPTEPIQPSNVTTSSTISKKITNSSSKLVPSNEISEIEDYDDLHIKARFHLVIALVLGLLLLLTVVGLVLRRIYDVWLRRHYQRMDFLVDGMYNSVNT